MNTLPMSMPEHRQRVLHALDITLWRRRKSPGEDAADLDATPATIDCVLLIPSGCTDRQHRFLATFCKAAFALPSGVLRMQSYVLPADGSRQRVMPASAYLVLGQPLADALASMLTIPGSAIVQVGPSPEVLMSVVGKRQLWHMLRRLKRVKGSRDVSSLCVQGA